MWLSAGVSAGVLQVQVLLLLKLLKLLLPLKLLKLVLVLVHEDEAVDVAAPSKVPNEVRRNLRKERHSRTSAEDVRGQRRRLTAAIDSSHWQPLQRARTMTQP